MADLWNLWTRVTYLGSSVSSTENDINTRLAKAWMAIDSLWVIWKSDLSDKIKCSFFQAAVVSILLYGCTIWILTKCMEKKLDGNCTKMLQVVLNNSWKQHPTKQQLYGHLLLILKTIPIRRARHAGHCWWIKGKLISYVLLWTPSHGRARLGNQQEPIYNNSVLTQDVAWKTYREQWTIVTNCGKGSGKSILMARHDDDDDNIIFCTDAAIKKQQDNHQQSLHQMKILS